VRVLKIEEVRRRRWARTVCEPISFMESAPASLIEDANDTRMARLPERR
jgi:hypothetical protein